MGDAVIRVGDLRKPRGEIGGLLLSRGAIMRLLVQLRQAKIVLLSVDQSDARGKYPTDADVEKLPAALKRNRYGARGMHE